MTRSGDYAQLLKALCITAAALERCETPQRFIVTAVQDRLEQDGLMVKITSDC